MCNKWQVQSCEFQLHRYKIGLSLKSRQVIDCHQFFSIQHTRAQILKINQLYRLEFGSKDLDQKLLLSIFI